MLNLFYDKFLEEYDKFVDPDDKQTIQEIKSHEKNFNPQEQNQILVKSNIYVDANGAYEHPNFTQFEQGVSDRIANIKNNMYTLPIMSDDFNTSHNSHFY